MNIYKWHEIIWTLYKILLVPFFLGKERWMAEQVAELLDEKCKVLETLSQCQQEVSACDMCWKTSGSRHNCSHITELLVFRSNLYSRLFYKAITHNYKHELTSWLDAFIMSIMNTVLWELFLHYVSFAVWWPGRFTEGQWCPGTNSKGRTSGGNAEKTKSSTYT